MGRQVFTDQRELNNFSIIDLEGHKSGLYILQLSGGEVDF
jgi:hypothetical protein